MQADVQWSDTRGTLSLGWAEVTLEASPGVLMLRAEAADEPALQQVQDLLGGLVGRVGRRADLMVSWQRLEARP